jgi:nonsense-mediated mRNA decay protein 3
MRCAICGSEALIEGLCLDCYLERKELFWLDDRIDLIKCPRCESFKLHGKWKAVDFESALTDYVYSNLRVHPDFDVEDVVVESLARGEVGDYVIRLIGNVKGRDVSVEKVVKVRVHSRVCERCSREAGGYYEAIVQIRAEGRKIERHELDTIAEIINSTLRKESDNQKAFISKIVERKEGVDFYFGDRNIGRKVSRLIVDKLGGKIIESKKLHTRIDGRDVYRFTYAVRLPCYRVGDIVSEGNKICIVTNQRLGKGLCLDDWSVVNLKAPKVVKRREELKLSVVVNCDEFVAEVLDEEMKVVQAKRPPVDISIGEEVFVFKHEEDFYVIPKDLFDKVADSHV